MSAVQLGLIAAAGFAAGAVNALAGGGTLISFPALLAFGMPPVAANVTSTVALCPGYLGAALAQRRELRGLLSRLWPLLVVAAAGGALGALLLLHTGAHVFTAAVPWLILLACLLLALQERVRAALLARAAAPAAPRLAWLLIAAGAVYGGYFGAGMGILMLAAMAIFIPHGLQAANGLKVLFACLINGIAAVYFLGMGAVRLPEAGLMAASSVFGGWIGAHLAQRLPSNVMRVLVVSYGLIVAGKLFIG